MFPGKDSIVLALIAIDLVSAWPKNMPSATVLRRALQERRLQGRNTSASDIIVPLPSDATESGIASKSVLSRAPASRTYNEIFKLERGLSDLQVRGNDSHSEAYKTIMVRQDSKSGQAAAYPSTKRGLCYSSPTALSPFATNNQLGWAQNWAPTSGSLPPGVNWYPEL